MKASPGRHALALLLLAAPCVALAAPRTVLISIGGEPDRALVRELVALVSRSGNRAVGPEDAASKLQAEAGPSSGRQRAAALLARATELTRNVRYDEALAALTSAETAAEAGLASVIAPRLLADIYLQRGLALLATDPAAGQGWLVQSFQLWPGRPLDPTIHAPRILQALRRAELEARRGGTRDPLEADLGLAARILAAQTILLLRTDAGRRARVTVRRFDARREAYAGTVDLEWPEDATSGEARRALRGLAAWFPRLEPQPTGGGGSRGTDRSTGPMTWLLLGVGAAAMGGGIGLAVHAQARADDAQAHANKNPPEDYVLSGARDAEDAARGARTGAIVCFSLSAAALVAALVIWRRGPPDRSQSFRVGVAPAGLSITY